MLEEVLCGRKICSERYRQARALLIDEVSNLVRIVLAYTFSRPETSVAVVEIDINKRNELTDGYLPGFVVKTSTRPQLKIDASQLLLRNSDEVLLTVTHVHHFVTNHAWLLTTKQLRAAVKRLYFDEPYCLVKNLTGKFMLTPKELMEDLHLKLPTAQYLLKNASTKNKF